MEFLGDDDRDPDLPADQADNWAVLRELPQDVWLLLIRHINWDGAATLLENMVDDPRCDRAVAAFLFWEGVPSWDRDESSRGRLTWRIAENAARGFYQSAELWLDRAEIGGYAQLTLTEWKRAGGRPSVYPFPRVVCGPFGTRRARLPADLSPETERALESIFLGQAQGLIRSEDEHRPCDTGSAHVAALDLPELPDDPLSAFAGLDDLAFIEAMFGDNEAFNRRERAIIAARRALEPPISRQSVEPVVAAPAPLSRIVAGCAVGALKGIAIALALGVLFRWLD
jgi:hypothetical protein